MLMRKVSVLIADDDESLLEVLKDYFENGDFEVFTADNGSTALKMYRTGRPDVAVLDYDMPEMNGREVLAEIRADDKITPVVIMTGVEFDEETSLDCYDTGTDFFIRKPTPPKELCALVKNLAKRVNGYVEEYAFGNSILNVDRMTLTVCGVTHKLTRRETDVLHLLVKKRDMTVPSDILLHRIWKNTEEHNMPQLANIIYKLKKMLQGDSPVVIETEYRQGYRMDCI